MCEIENGQLVDESSNESSTKLITYLLHDQQNCINPLRSCSDAKKKKRRINSVLLLLVEIIYGNSTTMFNIRSRPIGRLSHLAAFRFLNKKYS